MSAQVVRVDRAEHGDVAARGRRNAFERALIFGAPVAAALAGVTAEWLDVRALRYPLLLMVLAGVAATAFAIESRGRDVANASDPARGRGQESGRGKPLRQRVVRALIIGVSTWAAAEMLYVIIHAARGEAFEAERFGPQWAQALGLIGVHALFLGAPTGIVAGALLRVRARLWRGAAS